MIVDEIQYGKNQSLNGAFLKLVHVSREYLKSCVLHSLTSMAVYTFSWLI